ncbi:MAG: ATP phosphoribosyltransferase [Candidatus Altiarchaeota archaeon]|nr:ATP phosphoribosyltransferase [Candidatus Altiarchaeota archaeon]
MTQIRIAIPNKGRMWEPSRQILERIGLGLEKVSDKSLFIKTNNPQIDVIAVRVEDIPEFVRDGAADLGITGRDVIAERRVRVSELLPLNFGYCSLILAVPQKWETESVKQLPDNLKIATKFPNVAKSYLKKNKKEAQLVILSGAVEIAPIIGIADAVIDLTSTGTTLKTHGLRVIETILQSQAVLIGDRENLKKPEKRSLVDDIMLAIKGVVFAEKKKYLIINLPENKLPELEGITEGLLSPTITKLDKKGWVAAQLVVEENKIFNIIKKVKNIGGRDILVVPIERLVR